MQLLIALVVLGPLRADADPGTVVVVGKSDAHARDVTAQAVSAAVSKADWKLIGKRLSESDTSSISKCFTREEPQRCILRLVQDKGVQRVAYVSVDPDPSRGERGLKLTGRIVTAKLDLVLIASRFCDHCTDDTLARSATDLMKDLLDRVALTSGRTVLSVKSSPQGARYTVDGAFVGVTDASIDVTPGPHTVTVELEGFETFVQSVRATEGQTAEVNAVFRRRNTDVRPLPGPTDSSTRGVDNQGADVRVEPPRRSRAAKPLLVVGGVVLAAGVVLLMLDEDSTVSPPGTEQRATFYDTATPGLVTIAGGAVLAGLGAYFYWKSPGANATASIRPTPNGTMMTLSTSF
ncbi:MAG: PEGA domain-containing protein [Deltaproteobacteria bacterium]|nr:PEGA domain-containing protein [Deltaproteobacteria bacterium]